MKKLKFCVVSALVIGVMALGTGCASKDASKPADTTAAPTQAVTTQADSQSQAAGVTQANSEQSSGQVTGESEMQEDKQFTGTVEENKGFMITVKSDKDGESYVFDLSDEALAKGIKEGDKVVITYRGEDPSSTDVTDTMVLEVTKAK